MPLLHFGPESPLSEPPETDSTMNPAYFETLVSPENSPNELSNIPYKMDF